MTLFRYTRSNPRRWRSCGTRPQRGDRSPGTPAARDGPARPAASGERRRARRAGRAPSRRRPSRTGTAAGRRLSTRTCTSTSVLRAHPRHEVQQVHGRAGDRALVGHHQHPPKASLRHTRLREHRSSRARARSRNCGPTTSIDWRCPTRRRGRSDESDARPVIGEHARRFSRPAPPTSGYGARSDRPVRREIDEAADARTRRSEFRPAPPRAAPAAEGPPETS